MIATVLMVIRPHGSVTRPCLRVDCTSGKLSRKNASLVGTKCFTRRSEKRKGEEKGWRGWFGGFFFFYYSQGGSGQPEGAGEGSRGSRGEEGLPRGHSPEVRPEA